MKKIIYLLVVMVLGISLTGCVNNSDGAESKQGSEVEITQKEDDKKAKSKEVALSDYPDVEKAQLSLFENFTKFNTNAEKPVKLSLSKILLEETNNISVEYSCAELSMDVTMTQEGILTSLLIEGLSGEKDDAYLSAITATLMLEEFGFSTTDTSAITKAVSEGTGGGTYNGYEVSSIETGPMCIFWIHK